MKRTNAGQESRRLNKRRLPDSSATAFAIILAAISKGNNYGGEDLALIQRCLTKLHRSLSQSLSTPILSLLPVLISSKNDEVACKSIEIVGALSLMSIEMNKQTASEEQIVKGLVASLKSCNSLRSMAACNSILDLSTTSIGRKHLVDLFAIENLILHFFQDPNSSTPMASLLSDGKCTETCPKIVFNDDKLSILLVNAIIVLLNSCTIEQLHKIPATLSRGLLLHLKKVWEEVHQLELCGISGNCTQDGVSYINSIRTNNLAESVFRLSVDINPCRAPSVGFFNAEDTSLENFMLNIWESSPFLLRNSKLKNILSSFIDFSKLRESVPFFLSSMLRGLIHCPPIPSDEHDILHFLDEVSSSLGCPIVHQEDIRVVQTYDSESELHYFQTQADNINYEFPIIFSSTDILKCEQAYKEGYTIALRGMGFRYTSIASVADEVASMFGQPSIGVNLYVTPPGCQGLACHSDDHCVFICQLAGAKKWHIFSPAGIHLPRLYEAIEKKERGIRDACKEVLLKEGDILYIPRGHPHEAHTIGYGGGCDTSTGFSLHLTLSIEVEPPFEWEGFAHVGFYHWCRRQSIPQYILADSESPVLHKISAILIHIAVKLFGDTDPIFRKACLVGALSSACEHTDWLLVNQKEIFSHIICKIKREATFVDVLKHVEVAVEKHEDLFSHFKWTRHLLKGVHEMDTNSIHLVDANDVIHQISQNREVAEAVFYQVKSSFCSEVAFEDVQPVYVTLLDDYRKARKQYANGMLSLHCNDN